jgi:hypothetical protein
MSELQFASQGDADDVSASRQRFVLFSSERNNGKPAHSYERRNGEKFVGFNSDERDGLGERLSGRNFNLRIFGIRIFHGNHGRRTHGGLIVASFIDNQFVAAFHGGQIP